jgi:hypothetical protein
MGKKNTWRALVSVTKKKKTPQYQPPFIGSLMFVWYTVDTITYCRSILIEINAKEKNKVAKLPEINGWHSKAVSKTIRGVAKNYLQISERSVDTRKIAEMVIGDLSNNLESLKQRDQLMNTVIRTMKEWQTFFQSKGIMLKSAEQGLVGELSWLLQMIKNKEDKRKIIEGWCGPERTRHDFEFNDIHFEVKTTSRKDRRIQISSQHQLNNKGLKHLYLSAYKYNTVKSAKPTLPSLYDKILKIAGADIDLKLKIEISCMKIGYNDKKRNKHKHKFVEDGAVEVYEIINTFPKLVLTSRTAGIHDVSYTLDLNVCKKHKVITANVFPI